MTRQILIALVVSTILFGCDFSSQVKSTVDNGIKDAKAEIDSDISNAKTDFKKSYNHLLMQTNDSVFSVQVTQLHYELTKTAKYIDSLRIELDKLDDMDTKNIDLIRQMFITDGIGDSIFNKVKHSYSLTIQIAQADKNKSRLRKVQDTYTDETKSQLFGLNGPLGVNMILSGIESELIKDGTITLKEHLTN